MTDPYSLNVKQNGHLPVSCMQGDVLKKIPEDNYHGSDLELSPIDGVDSTLSSVGEVVVVAPFMHDCITYCLKVVFTFISCGLSFHQFYVL